MVLLRNAKAIEELSRREKFLLLLRTSVDDGKISGLTDAKTITSVYGWGHEDYRIKRVHSIRDLTREESSVQKTSIDYLINKGFKIGEFIDKNVKDDSLIVIMNNEGGICACLWNGDVLYEEGLKTKYDLLIE